MKPEIKTTKNKNGEIIKVVVNEHYNLRDDLSPSEVERTKRIIRAGNENKHPSANPAGLPKYIKDIFTKNGAE